jgi:hypothetical protein
MLRRDSALTGRDKFVTEAFQDLENLQCIFHITERADT